MISRPPVAPPESPTPPDCLKKQKAASLVLYIALVLLALWVVRDFIAVAAWAGVHCDRAVAAFAKGRKAAAGLLAARR